MKKTILALVLCMLLSCFMISGFNLNADEKVYVKAIYSSVKVYSSVEIEEDSTTILLTLSYGDVVELKTSDVITNSKGLNFYEIILQAEQEGTGFVLVSQTNPIEYNSPQRELDYNASIKKDAYVFLKDVNGFSKTETLLKAGTKIKVLNNVIDDYSQIQYVDQNGNIITCYVLKDALKVKGISRGTIAAIVIITTTVSLVLLIFGIKGRKKRLNKR